ncbi:MAG: hypothetical protein JSV04_12795 [Candidatus Heimdallarchaeota archaeon]|nr:MAG: hypothetical protein JSV04_12795 [Candidatus Heimdallarchaeota archaeon]
MPVEKEKVNRILIEFQDILKKYRPNTSELQLITSKISQMTARNIEKQFSPHRPSRTPPSQAAKSSKPKKQWFKIKID